MTVNYRREIRRSRSIPCSISWQDKAGLTRSAQAYCVNTSASGVALKCRISIEMGTTVYIQAQKGYPTGYGVVRHCTSSQADFILGLEWDEATKKINAAGDAETSQEYYEFLQISPKAQAETIARVYHFLAARYHPDNPETGDTEKFLLLNEAYEVLSDPERRARYDSSIKDHHEKASTVFGSVDYLDGVDGEINRRIAILSLLYRNVRANVHNSLVSLLDLEKQMGCPREYLDFAIWYLRAKKYIRWEDNAQMSLTAQGVDYIEENYVKQPLLQKLLNGGIHSNGFSSNGTGHSEEHTKRALHMLGPGDQTAQEAGHESSPVDN